MGIKGLEMFMEQLGNAIYETTIAELAQNYRYDRKLADFPDDEVVKILVDANTCQQVTFEFTGKFVGYEVQEYVDRVRLFVDEFRKLRIEPVFFFNDWMTKEDECKGSIANVRKAFDYLMAQNCLPPSYHLVLPSSCFTSMCILKYVLGCEVRYVRPVNYLREAILEYIQENDKNHEKKPCFAILTTSIEFVLCQTEVIVLSSNLIMNSDMRTRYYDRLALAAALNIHVGELPLLAVMAGKDTDTNNREINDFHAKCLGRRREMQQRAGDAICDLMEGIATIIRNMRKYEDPEIFENVCSEIMGSESNLNAFRKTYHSYFLPGNYRPISPLSIDLRTTIEDRYQHCKISNDVYTLLRKEMLKDIMTFDDLRDNKGPTDANATLTRDQPSFKVLQPLRQRLYGILLPEKKKVSIFFERYEVTECKFEAQNRYTWQVEAVRPTKPVVHHPGLMELWADIHDDTVLNNVRWTLFLKTVSPSLDVARWQSFDQELILPTLSVYYLYETKYLNESEVDVILVTIAQCILSAEKFPYYYHGVTRVLNMSIALYRTFTHVLNVLASCGYPFQLSKVNAYLKFESRSFQINYLGMTTRNLDARSLCRKNVDVYNTFKRMKDMINETENDKTSHSLAQMEV